MKEDAPPRDYSSRELFHAVRSMVRAGCPWRMIPHDLPPGSTVHQQAQRWIKGGCWEAMAQDLRAVLRWLADRDAEPTAVILDGRTRPSTPASGGRGGYDGDKRRKGGQVHIAVDTLGHWLALKITAANEARARAQVGDLAREIQAVTGGKVEVAFVDQGYTGEKPAAQAAAQVAQLVRFGALACGAPCELCLQLESRSLLMQMRCNGFLDQHLVSGWS